VGGADAEDARTLGRAFGKPESSVHYLLSQSFSCKMF
jgi:hypothetical protein